MDVVATSGKLQWLLARLPGFIDAGDVLIFANQKANVDELTAKLQAAGFKCASHSQTIAFIAPLPAIHYVVHDDTLLQVDSLPPARMITVVSPIASFAGPLQYMGTWISTRAWERSGTSRRDVTTSWWRQT